MSRSSERVLDQAYAFLMASPAMVDTETVDLVESLAIELSEQRELVASLRDIVSTSLDRLQSQDRTIDSLREDKRRLIAELRLAIGEAAA